MKYKEYRAGWARDRLSLVFPATPCYEQVNSKVALTIAKKGHVSVGFGTCRGSLSDKEEAVGSSKVRPWRAP